VIASCDMPWQVTDFGRWIRWLSSDCMVFLVFGAIQLGYPATVIESQSKKRRGSVEIMRRARVAETDTRKFNQVVFVCRHGVPLSRRHFGDGYHQRWPFCGRQRGGVTNIGRWVCTAHPCDVAGFGFRVAACGGVTCPRLTSLAADNGAI
jgi:hypothetical protein